ncbi:TonB family protein [Dyadobacter aurulentus]|uniref:TonB family protein n=1 Tax=Dyadobacter sp. UC 10 TaxID=2605428 RepID=UPI0011F32EAB|nr:TonB family protein [Dyadobacter sp. UC 10]KAA0989251.1 TonB family protein [Dyadobacter sp. UC 10]
MDATDFNNRFDYDADNDLLGEGGFGKIFKAWDNVRNEFIALKMSKVVPGMEEFSLLNEYERVKQLEHPNIARYMDCRRIKLPGIGTHDIALMKYYEHGNLVQLLKNHVLTSGQKTKLIEGLLDGISYLHKLKPLIIHSDLKPSNILIVERRGFFIPLITDFGISRRATVDDKSYVTNVTGAGTYAYAAPEQWEAKELRPNADLWSFGILAIYVWFNGKKLPFRSDDISIATESGRIEYMKRVMALDFIPDLKGLPETYQKMIDVCLVISPQNRARSVDQLYTILRGNEPALMDEQTKVMPKPAQGRPQPAAHDEKTKILPQIEEPVKEAIKEEFKPEPIPEPLPAKKKRYMIPVVLVSAAAIGGLSLLWITTDPKPPAAKRLSSPVVAPKPVVEEVRPPAFVKAVEKPKKKLPAKSSAATVTRSKTENKAVYHVVEESPRFPGGTLAMESWVSNNMQMPEAASRSFISGAVRVSFVVNADGTREDVQVVRGLGYGCDEEAIRLVKAMPRWIPGRTAGSSVRVRTIAAISFD